MKKSGLINFEELTSNFSFLGGSRTTRIDTKKPEKIRERDHSCKICVLFVKSSCNNNKLNTSLHFHFLDHLHMHYFTLKSSLFDLLCDLS